MRMFLLFVLALALPLPAQDPAVVNPKIVKVEFENDRVRVLRVRLCPHERLAMHSHPASAIVRLTERSARVVLLFDTSLSMKEARDGFPEEGGSFKHIPWPCRAAPANSPGKSQRRTPWKI